MSNVREPLLQPVAIATLRPTQITVGMREVKAKRLRWREKEKDETKAGEFLGKHMIPVILGPKERHYIVDHHHLARALHDEGAKHVVVSVVANLSGLEPDAFWFVLDNRSWMHPFDEDGRRRGYKNIPKSISGLVDDPFRSLAGELRRAESALQLAKTKEAIYLPSWCGPSPEECPPPGPGGCRTIATHRSARRAPG